ncbi:uncharacterized protein LOC101851623 [Aplysia californica]|uniref:Uncharacterized protein LOC101851623 n=1 Tax=Aplysia californica TaxID=6500 RepID=A0ABM1AC82_APLCA|nr:uncharacterized protein LOC101851623 [Aplysia californica]
MRPPPEPEAVVSDTEHIDTVRGDNNTELGWAAQADNTVNVDSLCVRLGDDETGDQSENRRSSDSASPGQWHERRSKDTNASNSDVRDSAVSKKASVSAAQLRRLSLGLPRQSFLMRMAANVKTKTANTYRMEPVPGKEFSWTKAKHTVEHVSDRFLADLPEYSSHEAPNLIKALGSQILQKIKKHDWPRYKFVCHVTLAQVADQGLIVADRTIWAKDTDNCVAITRRFKDYVAVITLHALYFE